MALVGIGRNTNYAEINFRARYDLFTVNFNCLKRMLCSIFHVGERLL